jgi:cell division protein FtsQ
MPGLSRILSLRRSPGGLGDLAERDPLIARQRVRRQRVSRRTASRLRRLSLGVLFLAVIAGSASLIRWSLSSPRFAITRVDVSGLESLSEAEVREAAGVREGENLFALDASGVAARLERLPRVKRVQVTRSLPGRVALSIEERRPFALLASGGRLYWVDDEGRVLGPEPRAVAPELPVLTGRAADGSEGVRMGAAFLRAMLKSGSSLLPRISEIDVGQSGDGPVLHTVDGIEVKLGSEAWEERLGRLQGVLAQIETEQEPIESIDLRFRDQVVLKPKRQLKATESPRVVVAARPAPAVTAGNGTRGTSRPAAANAGAEAARPAPSGGAADHEGALAAD